MLKPGDLVKIHTSATTLWTVFPTKDCVYANAETVRVDSSTLILEVIMPHHTQSNLTIFWIPQLKRYSFYYTNELIKI